jgi:hypothetical protein
MRLIRLSAFVFAALAPITGFAQTLPAGTVTLLNGQASATGLGAPAHSLAKGDAVYPGDTVETAAGSYTLIRFTDQGSVLLRPNSRFQVEKYQYAAAAAPAASAAAPRGDALAPLQTTAAASGGDSSFFRLLKGGLRAVSGLMAHANYGSYRMSTPVATMGIRGTDFEAVMCEDACLSDPTVLNSLPPGKTPAGGVVNGVNEGQITVTSYTGNSVTLGPGQYVITLSDGSQYLLNGVPAFMSSSTAAAANTGVAAGSAAAAQNVANGSLLTDIVVGTTTAVIIGVIVGATGDNGTTSTTATTQTAP